ncbi:protein ALP1-like [Aphis craccivora]|uniref:Protein ALP1-like n=1 Tax=Aphis craccivora TaxID=307492 RepID=A0A6G0Z806_APHCR|nr:protein ALP1-like [Aphis craccivora]
MESISAKEKLGVCLRQGIVSEVCNVIISKIKNECIPCPKKEDWVPISKDILENLKFSHCIVALRDEAFHLKNYLLRPYPGRLKVTMMRQIKYNERLSRERKGQERTVVEDTFVQLIAKFRIKCRRFKALLINADKIVMTT